jgi:hypothetical protein
MTRNIFAVTCFILFFCLSLGAIGQTRILPDTLTGVFVGEHPEDVMSSSFGDLPVFAAGWEIVVKHGSISLIKHRILSSNYNGPDKETTFKIRKINLISKPLGYIGKGDLYCLVCRYINKPYGDYVYCNFYIEVSYDKEQKDYFLVLKQQADVDPEFFTRTRDVILTLQNK